MYSGTECGYTVQNTYSRPRPLTTPSQKRRPCAGFVREEAHSGAACSWPEMLNMRRNFLHLLRSGSLVVKSNVNRGFKGPVRLAKCTEHLPTRDSCADCNC